MFATTPLPSPATPMWMPAVLRLAGWYNLAWGTLVILFPLVAFRWAGMPEPNYPQLWQCIGMIVGVYGIGYLLAARDPVGQWPLVLVGLLGKIFGPIGFVHAAWQGQLPWVAGLVILLNDVIWWVPFTLILRQAMNADNRPQSAFTAAIATARDQHGQSLLELSNRQPMLVVFLRHSGCTFCRESLSDLAQHREQIEQSGQRIAIVHMNTLEAGAAMLAGYGLADVSQFSDPERALYRAFELRRGGLWQVLGPRIWWRGFQAAVLGRHWFGGVSGDVLQLPGAFVVERGKIVRSFRHATSADRPDYVALACPLPPAAATAR